MLIKKTKTGRWTKPPINAELDSAHPLYRKMRDCVLFNEQAGTFYKNILKPQNNGTFTNGSPLWTNTKHYTGITSTTTNRPHIKCVDSVNYMAGDFTLRILFSPVNLPNIFSCLISKRAATDREFCMFFNTSGHLQYYSIGGGPQRIWGSSALTVGLQANRLYDMVLTGVKASDSLALYLNGSLILDNAGLPTSGTNGWSDGGTTNVIGLGTDPQSAPSNFGNFTFYGFNSWVGRALSASEVKELYNNPFSFVKAKKNPVGLDNAVAAALSSFFNRRQNGYRTGTRSYF